MAVIVNQGSGQMSSMCTALGGNGQATNIITRRPDRTNVPTLVRITTAIGATPTCTYLFEVSPTGAAAAADWFAVPTQDLPTAGGPPGTLTSATFVITTAATFWKLLAVDFPWAFLRCTFSANTNVTNTIDAICY